MSNYINNPVNERLNELCKTYFIEYEILLEKQKNSDDNLLNNSANKIRNIKNEMLSLLLNEIQINENGDINFKNENEKNKTSFNMEF